MEQIINNYHHRILIETGMKRAVYQPVPLLFEKMSCPSAPQCVKKKLIDILTKPKLSLEQVAARRLSFFPILGSFFQYWDIALQMVNTASSLSYLGIEFLFLSE